MNTGKMYPNANEPHVWNAFCVYLSDSVQIEREPVAHCLPGHIGGRRIDWNCGKIVCTEYFDCAEVPFVPRTTNKITFSVYRFDNLNESAQTHNALNSIICCLLLFGA